MKRLTLTMALIFSATTVASVSPSNAEYSSYSDTKMKLENACQASEFERSIDSFMGTSREASLPESKLDSIAPMQVKCKNGGKQMGHFCVVNSCRNKLGV